MCVPNGMSQLTSTLQSRRRVARRRARQTQSATLTEASHFINQKPKPANSLAARTGHFHLLRTPRRPVRLRLVAERIPPRRVSRSPYGSRGLLADGSSDASRRLHPTRPVDEHSRLPTFQLQDSQNSVATIRSIQPSSVQPSFIQFDSLARFPVRQLLTRRVPGERRPTCTGP